MCVALTLYPPGTWHGSAMKVTKFFSLFFSLVCNCVWWWWWRGTPLSTPTSKCKYLFGPSFVFNGFYFCADERGSIGKALQIRGILFSFKILSWGEGVRYILDLKQWPTVSWMNLVPTGPVFWYSYKNHCHGFDLQNPSLSPSIKDIYFS